MPRALCFALLSLCFALLCATGLGALGGRAALAPRGGTQELPEAAPSIALDRSGAPRPETPRDAGSPAQPRGLAFIENLGQWSSGVSLGGQVGGAAIGVTPDEILLLLPEGTAPASSPVRLRFEGASPKARVRGEDELPGQYHYYKGNDPSQWVEGARSFAKARLEGLYPGVDLVLGSTPGGLKYDLYLARAEDLQRVVVICEGAGPLRLEDQGALVLETAAGPLRQLAGRSWQVLPSGEEREVEVRFELREGGRFAFAADDLDPDLPLVIDPELLWSTYFGSSIFGQGDGAGGVALADDGDVVVVGKVKFQGFPTTPWSFQHPGNPDGTTHDVFVVRLCGDDGSLVYSSLIGGSGSDLANCVDVDQHGAAVVGGLGGSIGFPTTRGAFDLTATSNGSAFVLRLSAAGTLEFSTIFEGSLPEDSFTIRGLRIDRNTGSVVLAGTCSGAGMPTTPGAFDTTWNGFTGNGYVARLDPTGSTLEWGTYLGGFSIDELHALDLDGEGRVAVTGVTHSEDFPVTQGAFQTTFYGSHMNAYRAAFVTILDPTGSHLVWSSYLGGITTQEGAQGNAISFDRDGGVVVAGSLGTTTSAHTPTFPTTPGVIQPDYGGQGDAFVTRFTPDGSALIYSTYLGGPNFQRVDGVAVDPSGVATVAGNAQGGLPVTPGAFDTTWNGANDAFIVRLDPYAARVLYGSYFGGPSDDVASDIVVSPTGRTTIAGSTKPPYPTTPGAFQPDPLSTAFHGFATTLYLLHEGVLLSGDSTPSCLGPLQLNTYSMPEAGSDRFGFYLSGAPPSASGWILVGQLGSGATSVQGAQLWLDPAERIHRLPIQSDAEGYAQLSLPLPAGAAGLSFAAQALMPGTPTCPGPAPLAASNALAITVQ